MNIEDFNLIIKRKKNNEEFQFKKTDIITDKYIKATEKKLEKKLPLDFINFLKNYGGGYFGYINIFSLDPRNKWYILEKNKFIIKGNFNFFLAISDDETGGYFGYNYNCNDKNIFYFHPDDNVLEKSYDNIFHYIIETAFD